LDDSQAHGQILAASLKQAFHLIDVAPVGHE
jgi:hypothetical protein